MPETIAMPNMCFGVDHDDDPAQKGRPRQDQVLPLQLPALPVEYIAYRL